MQPFLTGDLKKPKQTSDISAAWPQFESANMCKDAVTQEIYIMDKVLSTVAINNQMYGRKQACSCYSKEVHYWRQM